MNPKSLYLLQLLFALAGTALAVYMLIHHTRLVSGIQVAPSFCSLGEHADCDAVNVSPFSTLLGIPIAAIGAVFYFFLFLLGCLGAPRTRGFTTLQRMIAWGATAGLIIDLYLFGVQLFILKNFCVMCALSYLTTVGVWVTAVLMQTERWMGIGGSLKRAVFAPADFSLIQIPTGAWAFSVVGFICFGGLTAFLPSIIQGQARNRMVYDTAVEEFFRQFKDKPIRRFEVKPGDAVEGNPKSPIQVMEFSDFECPHCQNAAFTMSKFLRMQGHRIQFVFRHFPLDSSCNPEVTYQMHPHACQLARLATCAVKKKKFKEFHDAVFFEWSREGDNKAPDTILQAVKSGPFSSIFTEAEYRRCLADDASRREVLEDIRLAKSLGIRATPTFFVNGKQVTIPVTLENLERLVKIEENPNNQP